jgi:hypothetical protein
MRMWGAGIYTAGAVASATTAKNAATAFLQTHIELLAPGASLGDFVLVSNHLDQTPGAVAMRTVGFVQKHRGLSVVGGQISFRFKADRLFVIGSEALPNVRLSPDSLAAAKPMSAAIVSQRTTSAANQLQSKFGLAQTTVSGTDALVILPLVSDNAVLEYVVARPITVATEQGNVLLYADPLTSNPIAVVRTDRNATATLSIPAVDRNPSRPRKITGLPRIDIAVAGQAMQTDENGSFLFSGTGQSISVTASGPIVKVVNKTGDAVSVTLPLSDVGSAVWDESGKPDRDAQLQAFLGVSIAKKYVATFTPSLSILGQQLIVNVNIANQCNANFDGTALNFFNSSMRCQNTALLPDVVFHEFGHAMHAASIIDGVGAFDGAMSEGLSDFLAASITGDPGMGRGFFFSEEPLRNLDPENTEAVWPRDIGEIHKTGIIFGGAMWDLRKSLIASMGDEPGIALTNRLFLGAVQRATSIPTTLIELLSSDDDDGNLSNGTPHECLIRAAFGRHGLRTVVGDVTAPGALVAAAGQTDVNIQLHVSGLAPACGGDVIKNVTVYWKGVGGPPEAGNMVATLTTPADASNATWTARVPLAPGRVVEYQALVTFADGSSTNLPENQGDPEYQMYEGTTVPLYCTDFERDPFTDGWTQTLSTGATPFEWGDPATSATSFSLDPPSAFSGRNILAQGLGKQYQPTSVSTLTMPAVNIGSYSDVRLQFRRWLGVEDGHFDRARVLANQQVAWANLDSNQGDSSSIHTIDREWRFADVPLSKYFRGKDLTVAFDLSSDQGLHLAGWQLDDLCIVANPASICGDGVKSATEQCDNGAGNGNSVDGCRSDCFAATCGDGIVDSSEECDVGGTEDPNVCSKDCKAPLSIGGGGLCQSGDGGNAVAMIAALMALCMIGRRRQLNC